GNSERDQSEHSNQDAEKNTWSFAQKIEGYVAASRQRADDPQDDERLLPSSRGGVASNAGASLPLAALGLDAPHLERTPADGRFPLRLVLLPCPHELEVRALFVRLMELEARAAFRRAPVFRIGAPCVRRRVEH